MPLLHCQSHLVSCLRVPSLTATLHPFSGGLQQQCLWRQCGKVVMMMRFKETLQAIRPGVVPPHYQLLPLLSVPGQHPFMAYCLLHQHHGKDPLLHTKQPAGLVSRLHTRWCMTASISITHNHQLHSSSLGCRPHSAATSGTELRPVKTCRHRILPQLSAAALPRFVQTSMTSVRLHPTQLSRPPLRRCVTCNCCTSILLLFLMPLYQGSFHQAKYVSSPGASAASVCQWRSPTANRPPAITTAMMCRLCQVSSTMKRRSSQLTILLRAMAKQA